MNDRFKFRAWKDKWGYEYDVEYKECPLAEYIDGWFYEVEQCIGVRDKNDRLVFEGDIVEDGNGKIFVIEWCQDKLGYVARTNNPEETLESLDISWWCWEVIGNVHTTPELLEKKDENN